MIDEQAGKAFEGVVDYQDADGNSITLDKLCRKEPAWAASRLRAGQERITELELAADGKNHMLTGCTESLNKALERVAELEAGIDAVESLINESAGVSGLYLNGDLAPWDELLAGGRFEEWLVDYSKALSNG